MDNRVIFFYNCDEKYELELEVPINITANDLIYALDDSLDLKMDTEDVFNNYLVAENPIAFLKGNRSLEEFGIRNGTKIIYKRS